MQETCQEGRQEEERALPKPSPCSVSGRPGCRPDRFTWFEFPRKAQKSPKGEEEKVLSTTTS